MSHGRHDELFIPNGHMNLKNDFRLLMLQFTFLQKLYISAVAADQDYSEAILKRWYDIPNQLKEKFQLVFGLKAEKCVEFLSMHIMYMVELVQAMKQDDRNRVDFYTAQLYRNGDELADFLVSLNPFWNELQWQTLLHGYINMSINEAVSIFAQDHERSLDIFDRLIVQSLVMGDSIGDGVIEYLTAISGLTGTNDVF